MRVENGDAQDVDFTDWREPERFAMSVLDTRPRERRPIHPGEILREDVPPEYALSVTALAEEAGVSLQPINELLRKHRAVTPKMALLPGKSFANSPECWLDLQRSVELWVAALGLKQETARIRTLRVTPRCLLQSGGRGGALRAHLL